MCDVCGLCGSSTSCVRLCKSAMNLKRIGKKKVNAYFMKYKKSNAISNNVFFAAYFVTAGGLSSAQPPTCNLTAIQTHQKCLTTEKHKQNGIRYLNPSLLKASTVERKKTNSVHYIQSNKQVKRLRILCECRVHFPAGSVTYSEF